MAQQRPSMRQLRKLLTLHFEQGLSKRALASSTGLVRSTIKRALRRFADAGLTWPLPVDMTDVQLEQALYRASADAVSAKVVIRPNYAQALIELARKSALEAACKHALELDAVSYNNIRQLLLAPKQEALAQAAKTVPEPHENLRGANYFGQLDVVSNVTITGAQSNTSTHTSEPTHVA
jgi:hypothetical protein